MLGFYIQRTYYFERECAGLLFLNRLEEANRLSDRYSFAQIIPNFFCDGEEIAEVLSASYKVKEIITFKNQWIFVNPIMAIVSLFAPTFCTF